MKLRTLLYLLPLGLFLLAAIFLYRGLYSDPRELESVLVDQPLPAFQAEDLFEPGRLHDSQVLRGQPRLLNVWATWCPTCHQEHAFLRQLAQQGVPLVGVNYKDDRAKAVAWLARLGNPYVLSLFDGDGRIGLELGVYGAPEPYLLDSQGIIRYRHVGALTAEVWQTRLKSRFEALK